MIASSNFDGTIEGKERLLPTRNHVRRSIRDSDVRCEISTEPEPNSVYERILDRLHADPAGEVCRATSEVGAKNDGWSRNDGRRTQVGPEKVVEHDSSQWRKVHRVQRFRPRFDCLEVPRNIDETCYRIHSARHDTRILFEEPILCIRYPYDDPLVKAHVAYGLGDEDVRSCGNLNLMRESRDEGDPL